MNSWVIKLEFPGEDKPKSLKFTDLFDVLSAYKEYNKKFVDLLVKAFKKNNNYVSARTITTVTDPDGKDWSNKRVFILFGIQKSTELPVALLFIELKNGGAVALGICPDILANMIKKDTELYTRILDAFLNQPKFWEQVFIIFMT